MSVLQVNNITDTGGSTLLGRRNAIINGNFDVWQRGTSFTASGGEFTADRWDTLNSGTTSFTASQQLFTVGQTDVPHNPKYYHRNAVTTGGAAGDRYALWYKVEGVSTFAGETVTLSFYAKADASKNIAVEFVQSFGSGGSPSTVVTGISVTTVALTTSWAKYTVTADIPSITGKTLGTDGNDSLAFAIWLDAGSTYNARTNSLGNQSGTFEFAQVQLEAGSVATPFERRSVGEELALCQRYYQRSTLDPAAAFTYGQSQSVTAMNIANASWVIGTVPCPVTMRATPTDTHYGSTGVAGTVYVNGVGDVTVGVAFSSNGNCSGFKSSAFTGGTGVQMTYELDAEL